jgi:PKD repeat protein
LHTGETKQTTLNAGRDARQRVGGGRWRLAAARGVGCGAAFHLGSLLILLCLMPGRSLSAQGTSACQAVTSAPAPAFSVSCASLSCTFTLTFTQPSGASNAWDFGDGATSQDPSTTVAHGYAAAGSYLVTLTVTDASGTVGVATAIVTLGSSAPLAADDAFTTTQNIPLTITIQELLANDAPGVTFLQSNDSSKCSIPSGAASCTYTPSGVGPDHFTYTVRDALGNTGSATVWITVLRALVANPDYFTVSFDGYTQITSAQLLANDTQGAVFVSAQDPLNGSLSLVSAGPPVVYKFTPTTGFSGDASFDYFISWDGNPPYERGIVTVTVVDAPPTANFTFSCTNLTCTVRSTSSDPDSTPVSRWLWNWGDGTPTIEPTTPYPWADQTHTYAASGRYTVTHTVYDTIGQVGSIQQAVVANIAPVAVNDTATTLRDTPVVINVLANDYDPDGDPLSIASVNMQAYPAASWQVVPSGSSWALKVTPPDAFVGTMTFTYVVSDPLGATATATVTLTVNQTSIVVEAFDQQFYCAQNGSLRIPNATLLAVDYDSVPGQTQTLKIIGIDKSVLSGTLDCTTDPTACTYTPPINAYGFTVFRYTIADQATHQDTGTVRIWVGATGQGPTANDVYFTTTYNTAKTFTYQDVVQNDVDPDGDTLMMGLQSGKTGYGTLSCTTPMYSCTYTPNAGYVGPDRFSYTASDGIYPPVTATINILTLPATTPTFDARENVIVTGVNQSAYFSNALLTSNAYVPSGGPVTVTGIDTTGLIGSLSCDSFGCTYTPPYSFQGATTFRYTANDGHGATDTAVVKIRVGGTDSPPVAVAQRLSTPKNMALRFSVFELMQNDYDPENDPLTVTVYTFNAHLGTLDCGSPNYWCTYTPNGTTGADTITYLLSDGTNSVTSTVTISITN